MSLCGSHKEDILGIASLNHLLSEAVESWLAQAQGDNSVQLKLPEHILVLVIHISFLAVGFKPVKDKNSENIPKLTSDWNLSEPYEFHYLHAQSQFHFQLKAISLYKRLIFHATAEEIHETFTLEAMLDELISEQLNFPINITSESVVNLELCQLFISHSKLTKFITVFRQRILQKLIPGLHKEGYQEISSAGSSAPGSPRLQARENRRPVSEFPRGSSLQDDHDLNLSKPHNPLVFGEPEVSSSTDFKPSTLESDNPIKSTIDSYIPDQFTDSSSSANPLAYGDSDINPLGGIGGGLPRLGGGSALDPFGLNSGGDGGMILGPGHPIFNPRPGFNPPTGDSRRLPPGAAPPGARFDPITPLNPGGSLRHPSRRGPQFPFSGEPDNDEAPPPGYNDMYM